MIKDMPHTTVEQVLELRKAALKLEQENAELKRALELKHPVLDYMEKDINKIKADVIRDAKESFIASHKQGGGVFGEGFDNAIMQYDGYLDKYANNLEARNEATEKEE
ncbi:MAG: hypothetical protein GY804_11730 [Alphaproteobacteria bacterium]|nr:hypothetical protein [Alphaproteobacteria bacterium]